MKKNPYLTFSSNQGHVQIRVSQLKPYIGRIKLPKNMHVTLTVPNIGDIDGVTSEDGYFIILHTWPDAQTKPEGEGIVQMKVSYMKYWQEYSIEDAPE